MKYAHLEEKTNKILGWYSDDVHSVIPTPNVEVTEDIWQDAIDNNANTYKDKKFIYVDYSTDADKLEAEIQEAKQFLNRTDKKMLSDYEFKADDNSLEWYIEERKKARNFIRENN